VECRPVRVSASPSTIIKNGLYALSPYVYVRNNPINAFDFDGKIDWPLKGYWAVNKKDFKDGARGLKNTIVRTSTYLEIRNVGTSPHIGIDYRASEGTPFYSLGNGIVSKIGKISSGAKYIVIEYGGGDKVRFLHLNKISEGLKVGTNVYEGQVLGETGKTGASIAHLHVDAVDKSGKRINPENKNYGTVTNSQFFKEYKGDFNLLHAYKQLNLIAQRKLQLRKLRPDPNNK